MNDERPFRRWLGDLKAGFAQELLDQASAAAGSGSGSKS
jgi:hypothetical protein